MSSISLGWPKLAANVSKKYSYIDTVGYHLFSGYELVNSCTDLVASTFIVCLPIGLACSVFSLSRLCAIAVYVFLFVSYQLSFVKVFVVVFSLSYLV